MVGRADEGGVADHVAGGDPLQPAAPPGTQFNRKKFGLSFGLSFGLKNHLSSGFRFPTLRKRSKKGSLEL